MSDANTAYKVVSKKSNKDYFLHSKEVTLRGDRKQKIFYFSGKVDKDHALTDLPEGYMVIENARTGLPMLKKEKK